MIEFSPCERYLVSYSSQEPSNPREKATVLFTVFDTRTGQKLRSFTGSVDDYAVGTAATSGGALSWPVFKWSQGCVPPRPRGRQLGAGYALPPRRGTRFSRRSGVGAA